MSDPNYNRDQLTNSNFNAIRQLTADVELLGRLVTDLQLIITAHGGPIEKQVEQIILKGQSNNGN